jgi:type IV fimbrial biogenesis protein FimT
LEYQAMIKLGSTKVPAGGHRPGQYIRGFTLVELMIVLVIIGVILIIGVPSFSQINLSTKLKAYANDMVGSVHLARGEAIKRNSPVLLCASADGAECAGAGDWEQGWIVLADPNEPDEVVVRHQQALSGGYKFTSSGGHTLSFEPNGLVSTLSEMKVCRQTPSVGNQERKVQISATGRPRVERTEDGTCP